MKKLMFSLIGMLLLVSSASALSFEESRKRAWYLTDKMAYELNLTTEQYDKAYEINFNYFYNVNYPGDIDGAYWRYRNQDLSYVLFDWQYSRFMDIEYFYRPLIWRSGVCIMVTYDYYDRGFYYFNRPTIFDFYRGISWNRRPKHSPYRDMVFHADRGMRDHYGNDGHGYYFRNGLRYDAPKFNGDNYGRRGSMGNPGRDFDRDMNVKPDNNRRDDNHFGNNRGNIRSGGSNYRDRNENNGGRRDFSSNSRDNNSISRPSGSISNNRDNNQRYSAPDNNGSNRGNSENASSFNRRDNSGSNSNISAPKSDNQRSHSNIRTGGSNNRSNSSATRSQQSNSRNIQSSSSRNSQSGSRNSASPSTRSNSSPSKSGGSGMRVRSF